MKRDVILKTYLICIHFLLSEIETTTEIDSGADHRKFSPDIVSTLYDLSYVAQGTQVIPSDPDHAMDAPSRAFWSLARVINCS